MDKIIIPLAKPRNAFVPLARSRKAGAHAPNRRKNARDERRLKD